MLMASYDFHSATSQLANLEQKSLEGVWADSSWIEITSMECRIGPVLP